MADCVPLHSCLSLSCREFHSFFLCAQSGIQGPFRLTQECCESIPSIQSHCFGEQKKVFRNEEWTLNNCSAATVNDGLRVLWVIGTVIL